ncbi:hypothetical protein AALP_AA1G219300 [Arabis alpina]|uniref:Uncharacterized protein n=1 Tax=Arabis alpina TaxID=50452 RepID=A0A087HPS6_ARAAL|nr:hypothetical protein AALP_AA1G219300 [Arabis alpina]
MEGKAVLLSVLIMSLVMAQIQLGAAKIVDEGGDCPKDYPFGSFVHSVDLANGYCKLGCVSSVCGPINTLQKSDASEIVNGAVAQCTKACASLCTKEFITA